MRLLECGCCGFYHKEDYEGDCRNDNERWGLNDITEEIVNGTSVIEIVPLEEQEED